MKKLMNSKLIAIVGMACHYPGAQDLRSFWENILTRRRQFRPLPDTRLPASDYYDPDPAAPDKTYCRKAGLLDGFAFNPAQYRIPRSTFESADIVHWLALKVALASLDDAGFSKASVPRERTGVILGNTLTGEYSRSEGLRLRWPFVRRVVEKAALEKGLSSKQTAGFLRTTEAYYKSVFTPITEDTLAGALSNTIAGRICNYLDLHGGGYTVDGACSSSIIATATAATHLVNRDLDLALAGGVDISLDTFELVGFAKTAALATEDMRVYDRRANGFIPGEGCGFVVMKRLEDAVADGDYVYAVLHGWGISSDGKGGLTAPNAQGQARALQRAYERADWNMNDVDFIEGHGTGTAVGDKTELEGIALAMKTMNTMNTDSGSGVGVGVGVGVGTRHAVSLQDEEGEEGESTPLRRCGITSLKSLVGHTKAASGVGALIKTVIALNQRILPPLANCFEPSPVFAETTTSLYPLLRGEIRPPQEILRAGVSGMGFGGINSHLALASGDAPSPKLMPAIREQKLLADYQRTELFVFSAPTVEALLRRVQAAEDLARNICEGERLDLAAHLATLYGDNAACGPVRAAIMAESPEMLMERLAKIVHILGTSPPKGQKTFFDPRSGICIGNDVQNYRVGFLFPGQGSQQINMGYQLVQRHDWAEEMVKAMEKSLGWPEGKQLSDFIFRPVERALDESQVNDWQEQLKRTEIAQPALCLASMLRLEQLARLGIQPEAVGGHSLGELTSFYAAGAYSREELIGFAALRGQAMTPGQGYARGDTGGTAGTMASLACSADQAQAILDTSQGYAVVANKNSPSQTVISGEPFCIEQACRHAEEQGIRAVLLPVANAFHSRFVSSAAQVLTASRLLPVCPNQLTTKLFSGLQGGKVDLDCDLRRHFSEQVILPVDFISLVQEMSKQCDLFLEVGPSRVLTGLARSIIAKENGEDRGNGEDGPICFPLETKPEQDRDLNLFLANYFVRGGTINWHALYEDRLVRSFTPVDERVFFANPCERSFPEYFPEQKEQSLSLPSSHSSGQVNLGETGRVLADAAGLSKDELAVYLERRSQFIGSLIRVDIDNMASLLEDPLAPSKSTVKSISVPPVIALFEKKKSNIDGKVEAEEQNSADLLFALIEERTGFPPESLALDLRLLDDLNLDSIKASELIAEAANRAGVSAANLNVFEYANATLQEVAALLDGEPEQDKDITKNSSSRYPSWARDFTLQYIPKPLSSEYADEQPRLYREEEILILFEPAEQHIAEHLEAVFHRFSAEFSAKVELVSFAEARQGISSLLARFTRVIALLPQQESGGDEFFDQQTLVEHITRLHTIFSPSYYRAELDNQSLSVVQFGGGFFGDGPVPANIRRCSAKALAASLHLEQPGLKVRVLDVSPQISQDQLCEYIMVELTTAERYAAVGYAADQIRRVPAPVLRSVAADKPRLIRWSPKDVVLATGGAKGITAECVLAFGRATGVQLALVGSSSPTMRNEQQDEILYTLKRANEAGLSAHYYQCDVTDAEAVKRLVHQVENEQGTITGVIHGSALNRPGGLDTVPVEQALEEISPKVIGAMNLCAALHDHPPQLFIAFSSLIGISGMRQNGWYGFSNEALHLFLRQYGKAEPRTDTLTIAFSIWDEVGMGSRMGSTSWLSTIGVDALTVQQGTSRFLQLALHDPGVDQVIVTARAYGIDTFLPHGLALPQGLRFIDKVIDYQPGVEIIARTRLTLEDDPYIKDHCWRGTYLFPLVFGLEAMAQAVRTVTGKTCFDAVCIEDIELARPIVLSEDIGAEIEIHALVLEQDDLEAVPQVQVQIRTEQTDFREDHFSAIFVLRDDCSPVWQDPPEGLTPLDILPKIDLYKEELLFQGPLYQKIQQIFQLASDICLFTTVPSSETTGILDFPWILGDPFCRDSFLQSGQVSIPRDLCLPVRIQRIERYPVALEDDESVWGKAVIEEHAEKYIDSAVTAFNKQGRVIERITGYRARIIEHKKENPTAEDLVYPGRRDCKILLSELKQRATLLPAHCMLPELSSYFISCLQSVSKEVRRGKELPFIKNALAPLLDASNTRIEISWSQEGKPFLAIPTDAGVHFSLTHNEGTLVCTAGQGLQGCDLETVSSHSKEEWQSLLGKGSAAMLAELTEQDNDSTRLDQSGTRLWTTFEAVFKALAIQPDASKLRIAEKQGDTVLFLYGDCCILTFPVRLTLRGERMLAVVVPEKCSKNKMLEQDPLFGNTDVRPNQVGSFTHEFITTFLEGRGPQGKVYFTNIPVWMGELRELALLPIADLLVQDMKSRQCGMVTNRSFFSVDQQLDSYDTVIGEVRLLQDTDLTSSFLSLGFNWFKKKEDGSLIRAASGKLSTTWVTVKGHGKVQLANLPTYFKDHFMRLPLAQDDSEPAEKKRHSFFSKASLLFTATLSTRKHNILFRQQFLTSQEDSNLVGNIYFSNYYSWQARVRDQYIATNIPDISPKSFSGDFVCVYAEVYHLQEAMPFEIIEVSMYLYELFSEGFTLYFEYYSVSEHGTRRRKLAHGEHSVVWVPEGQELSSEIHPAKMPEEYVAHFMTMIDNSEKSHSSAPAQEGGDEDET